MSSYARLFAEHVLEAVVGDLHPALHAGLDHHVARFLARHLHEHGHRGDAVRLVERHDVERGVAVGVGDPLVALGRDEPPGRGDLAVLAVEADLEVLVLGDVAPLAADPQVDLAHEPRRPPRSRTSGGRARAWCTP